MRCPSLRELPPPPNKKTGWPWTEETPPQAIAAGTLPPKITVVTPSFMQGMFLEETIRSVLLQGYPDVEYFIIDGGSTDGSVEIIKKYAPWLAYWVSEKDRGQSDAINKGLKRACGDIIAYINSDDWYAPGAFQTVAQRATTCPDETWWAGWVDNHPAGKPPERKLSSFTSMVEFLGRSEVLQQPGVFWKRELQEKVGLFNDRLHFLFDHEYWVRSLATGYRPVNLDAPIANFRIHGESKSCLKQRLFMRETREVARKFSNLIEPRQQREVENRIRDYEAHYFVKIIYGLLENGGRLAAIGYLIRSLSLLNRIRPVRIYFGAWARALLTGKPPGWYRRI